MRLLRKGCLLVVLVGLLAALSLSPEPVLAASSDNSVVVHYDDKIQITYNILYPDGHVYSGPGDIQLGVLRDSAGDTIIRQLYCSAATVPFHDSQVVFHPSPYVDAVDGYAISAPQTPVEAGAESLVLNSRQVSWLVANGYYDDGQGMSPNNVSIQSLNARYGNGLGTITAVEALVATKIAIWHYTDPMVSIMSTTLSQEEQIAMYRLVKALIADADAYAFSPAPAPIGDDMALKIDASSAQAQTVSGQSAYYYYGPLSVVSNSDNDSIKDNLGKAFLSLSGRSYEGSITFTTDTSGSPASALPTAVPYGQNSAPQPYVDKGQQFYLKVERNPSTNNLSGISINAVDRAADITYKYDTPQLVVYGPDDGRQDWNMVQSFVGLMAKGSIGDIYGQASLDLNIGLAPEIGHIYVSKTTLDINGNATDPDDDDEFEIALTSAPPGATLYHVKLNKANHWTSAMPVSVEGDYTVKEVNVDAEKYTDISQYDSAAGFSFTVSQQGEVELPDTPIISFTNQRNSGIVILRKQVLNADDSPGKAADSDVFAVTLQSGSTSVVKSLNNIVGLEQRLLVPTGTYELSEVCDGVYDVQVGASDKTLQVLPGISTESLVENRLKPSGGNGGNGGGNDGNGNGHDGQTDEIPKTADSHLILMLAALLCSTGALAVVVALRQKPARR